MTLEDELKKADFFHPVNSHNPIKETLGEKSDHIDKVLKSNQSGSRNLRRRIDPFGDKQGNLRGVNDVADDKSPPEFRKPTNNKQSKNPTDKPLIEQMLKTFSKPIPYIYQAGSKYLYTEGLGRANNCSFKSKKRYERTITIPKLQMKDEASVLNFIILQVLSIGDGSTGSHTCHSSGSEKRKRAFIKSVRDTIDYNDKDFVKKLLKSQIYYDYSDLDLPGLDHNYAMIYHNISGVLTKLKEKASETSLRLKYEKKTPTMPDKNQIEVEPDGVMKDLTKENKLKNLRKEAKSTIDEYKEKSKKADNDNGGAIIDYKKVLKDRKKYKPPTDYNDMLTKHNNNVDKWETYNKDVSNFFTVYKQYQQDLTLKNLLIGKVRKQHSLGKELKMKLEPLGSADEMRKKSDSDLMLTAKTIKDEITLIKKEADKKTQKENEKKYPADTGAWISFFKGKKMVDLFNKAYTIEGAKRFWVSRSARADMEFEAYKKKYKNNILSVVIEEHLLKFLKKNKIFKYTEPTDKSMYHKKFLKLVKEARVMDKAGSDWRQLIFRPALRDNGNFKSSFKDTDKIRKDKKETKQNKKAETVATNIQRLHDSNPNKTAKEWRMKLMGNQYQQGISFDTKNRQYIINALAMDEAYKRSGKRLPVLLGTWNYSPKYSNDDTAVYIHKSDKQIKIAYKGTDRMEATTRGFKEIVVQDLLGILLGGYAFAEFVGLLGSDGILGGLLGGNKTVMEIYNKSKTDSSLENKMNGGNKHIRVKGSDYFFEFNNRLYDFLRVFADYKHLKNSISFTGHSLGGRMAIMVAETAYKLLGKNGLGLIKRPFNVASFGTGTGGGQIVKQLNRAFFQVLAVAGDIYTGDIDMGTAQNLKTIYEVYNKPQTKYITEGVSIQAKEFARLNGLGWTPESVPYKLYRVPNDFVSINKDTGFMFAQKEIPQSYCSVMSKESKKSALLDPHKSLNFLPLLFWDEKEQKNECEWGETEMKSDD